METLAKRLKRLRQKRGISCKEMAYRIGVPETTYREWEYGNAIRSQPYLKIAEILGVGVYELMGGAPVGKAAILGTLNEMEKLVQKLKNDIASWY